MISTCEKVSLQQLRKKRIFNTSLNIALFSFFFLTEPHTYLCNTPWKCHGFLISCFEYGKILQKCDFILPFFFEQDHICMCMYVLVHTFTYIKVI